MKAHPLSFLRQRLDRCGVTPNARLTSVSNGKCVCVAGLVLVRQRPGKGNAIFLTLEDEEAVANIIIWERNFEKFRPVIMGSKFVRVTGRLQAESDVVHIVAEKIEDLTPWLAELLQETALPNETALVGKKPASEQKGPEQLRSRLAPFIRKNNPVSQDLDALTHKAAGVMPKGRNFQ